MYSHAPAKQQHPPMRGEKAAVGSPHDNSENSQLGAARNLRYDIEFVL